MAQFEDTKGRRWTIRITPYAMRQVRDFCDINLGTIYQDDMKGLVELLSNELDLCSVLWAICQDEAEKREVSIKDFLESMDADVILSASEAFLEGLQEMYPPNRALGVQLLTKILKNRNAQIATELEKYSTELTGKDTPTAWADLLAWTRRTLQGKSST